MLNTAAFYVVFDGWKPGVYESWEECNSQIKDYDDPKFRKYDSLKEAKQAFRKGMPAFYRKRNQSVRLEGGSLSSLAQMILNQECKIDVPAYPVHTALCVYVRVNEWTKKIDYVFDWINKGQSKNLFRMRRDCPPTRITRNLAEFDALVQGLTILKFLEPKCPIYTESDVAMSWVAKKGNKYVLTGADKNLVDTIPELRKVIDRRFGWLYYNQDHNPVLKWHRQHWGESPAEQHPLQSVIDVDDVECNADDRYEWIEPFPYH
jgi:ribonuclease HI